MKGQEQRSMFDEEGRKNAIAERLAGFDREAAAAGDPEEMVRELRAALEGELEREASLLPPRSVLQGAEPPSDYQRLRGWYVNRQLEGQEGHLFEYPHSPGLQRPVLDES